MFRVRDCMTKDPVCVDPAEKISAVLDLMRMNHIHRIPVVNENDELKGLITEGMIAGQGNSATSLSIYELNYLLSKTEVKTVMERRPVYVHENALMEEATELMLKKDIGCLPVVDDSKKVVGILTQNDIFKSFLEMLGWDSKGTRLIVEVRNDIGVLSGLSEVFTRHQISMRSISVYAWEGDIARILIKTMGEVPADFRQALEEEGYPVLEMVNY